MTRNIKVLPSSHLSAELEPNKPYPPPTLLPALKSDIHELARIEVEALSSNLLFRLYFSDPTKFYRSLVASLEQLLEEAECQCWIVKAVTDEGELMGWGAWCLRPADLRSKECDPKPFQSWMMVKPEEEKSVGGGDGKGGLAIFPSVAGLPQYVHDCTRTVLDDWMLGRRHLLLNALFTKPEYRRRGVGTAILKWGNEKADRRGLPCFLQSTPEGHGLYRREGWKNVGQLDVDLRDWVRGGGEGMGWGTYRIGWLVRLPEDRRENERERLVKKLNMAGGMKDSKDMVWGVDFM
jgi:hypothetical protein